MAFTPPELSVEFTPPELDAEFTPPELEEPSFFDEATDVAEGVVRTLGQGLIATPAAGLAGLGTLVTGGSLEEAVSSVEETGAELGFTPETEAERRGQEIAAFPFEKLAELGNMAGDQVLDFTGSPAAATAADTAVQFLTPIGIVKGVKALKNTGRTVKDVEGMPIPKDDLKALEDGKLEAVSESNVSLKNVEAEVGAIEQGHLLTPAQAELLNASTGNKLSNSIQAVKEMMVDPQYYAEFKKAGAKTPQELRFYERMDDWIQDVSSAEQLSKNMSGDMMEAVGFQRLPRAEHAEFMKVIKAADENPVYENVHGKPSSRLTPEQLAELTDKPEVAQLYNRYVDWRLAQAQLINKQRSSKGLEPFQPIEGIIPHRWAGRHLVAIKEGNQLVVKAFDSNKAASDAIAKFGGERLDISPEMAKTGADHLVATLAESFGKISKIKDTAKRDTAMRKLLSQGAVDKIMHEARKISPSRAVDKITRKRVGAKGFTNLDDFSSFVEGTANDIQMITSAINKGDVVSVGEKLRRDLIKAGVDNGFAERVVGNTLVSMSGLKTNSVAAHTMKSMAYHTQLGIWNTMVPAINIAFNKAWELPQTMLALKKAGIKDPLMLKTASTVTHSLNGMRPFELMSTKAKADVLRLEKMGAISSRASEVVVEPGADLGAVLGSESALKAGGKELLKANSYLMRNTELAARRSAGLTGLDLAKQMGLKGAEEARFVTKFVNKVAGEYNKGLRPKLLEGGTGATNVTSTAMVFSTYVWKKLIGDIPLFAQALTKGVVTPSGKRVRTGAPAAIALGTLWAFGGLDAWPGAEFAADTLIEVMDEVNDEEGEVIKAWAMLKDEHRLAAKGPLNDATGLDFASRTQFGLPLGLASPFGFNALGWWQLVGEGVQGMVEGTDKKFKLIPGDMRRRIESGQALANEGEFVSLTSRSKVPVDVKNPGILWASMILGATPDEVSRYYGAVHADMARERVLTKDLEELRNELSLKVRDEGIESVTQEEWADVTAAAVKAEVEPKKAILGIVDTGKKLRTGVGLKKPRLKVRDIESVKREQFGRLN